MRANTFLIVVALLTVPFCTNLNQCKEKAILEEISGSKGQNFKIKEIAYDRTYAYNDVASCQSLIAEGDDAFGSICCYIKLKFKNPILDEKFTQKGCFEFNLTRFATESSDKFDFGEYKDLIKGSIEAKDYQMEGTEKFKVEVKTLDIDCSSKYLHLVGLALILFLL